MVFAGLEPTMLAKWIASVSVAALAAGSAPVIAQEAATQTVAAVPQFSPRADDGA